MINIKSSQEIKLMKQGGRILAEVLFEVIRQIKPGVSELELDALAEKLIIKKGGEPGFKKVKGYHHSICVSVNDVVVHGIPTTYGFKENDIVGVDCGVFYKGFHTDMAETVRVSGSQSTIKKTDEVQKFLNTGKKALKAGIEQAKVGNRVGHISKAIQDIVEKENGYSIVRSLVGHGVGRSLHEEPEIPGFLQGKISKTPEIIPGMTIAVEVIYNQGKRDVRLSNDRWTIKTEDNSISGLFERSILIAKNGPELLTTDLSQFEVN